MFGLLKKKLGEFSQNLKSAILEKRDDTKTETPVVPETPPAQVLTHSPLTPTTPTAAASQKPADTPDEAPVPAPSAPATPKPAKQKRSLHAEIGLLQKAKSLLGADVQLSKKELSPLLDEFELALLEADVEQDTATAIVEQLRTQLAGQKVSGGADIDAFIRTQIKNALSARLAIPDSPQLLAQTRAKKPFVILVLGPNGAGKTTTIAKLCRHFQKNGQSVLLAAGDTFRAASIEQLAHHADKLAVRIVKQGYGADPAAVGFDAVAAAKSHSIDIVLIDSAGRQETNQNLMKELEKIVRVTKPDLKLYILEGYSGQAALGQIKEFDRHLGLDGFVLTKMDTDPKGGGALSVLYHLKKPIYFIGTGQGYDDLEEFELGKLLDKIV